MTLPKSGINNFISNHGNTLNFTVDTAQTSVPFNLVGTPPIGRTTALIYFQFSEPIFIWDIMVVLPYQFGLGEVPPTTIRFGYVDANAHAGVLDQLGNSGDYEVPDSNIYFPVNTKIDVPANVDTKWAIRMNAISGWVNMFNTPAILDTTVQQCRVMLRVSNTFNMIS